MIDVGLTVKPKSNQLNADDLVAGPITITITDVTGRESEQQPIAVSFAGDGGRPFMPCLMMRRLMIHVWETTDGHAWVGRSVTLFRDPSVMYGAVKTGGVRISHMSGINNPVTVALTEKRGSRKPYTVKPLTLPSPTAPTTARPGIPRRIPEPAAPPHDPETGEIDDRDADHWPAEDESARMMDVDKALTKASIEGWKPLTVAWNALPDADQAIHRAALENRHKPAALHVERLRKAAADAANTPTLVGG